MEWGSKILVLMFNGSKILMVNGSEFNDLWF